MATSLLTQRVDAFVLVAPPSRTIARCVGGGSAKSQQQGQQQFSRTAAQGRLVSGGLARALPGWKRRVVTAMSSGDGARWAPIPNAPNMKVSLRHLLLALSLSLRDPCVSVSHISYLVHVYRTSLPTAVTSRCMI